MKFSVMLIGVGGEGVLTTGVLLSKAANIEGHYVRGVQLHGLAQRGGSIPTFVRFGSEEEISSPGIMEGDADLVLAYEPLEALRAAYYASKEKTNFLIDTYTYVPIYANILNKPYPDIKEIVEKIKAFAKKVHVLNSHELGKENFGDTIFGNSDDFLDNLPEELYYLAEIACTRKVWSKAERSENDTPDKSRSVSQIAQDKNLSWERIKLDEGAKGPLYADVTRLRVFISEECKTDKERWLFLRKDPESG